MKLEVFNHQPGFEPESDNFIILDDLLRNPLNRGWHFNHGDPELWRYSDQIIKPGGQLLDLGFGWGRNSMQFTLKGMHVTGYERNPEYVEIARSIAKKLNLSLNLRDDDFHQTELPENFYDVVLASKVLHHVYGKDKAFDFLDKAYRAVKPGGYIFADAVTVEDTNYSLLTSYSYLYPGEVTVIDANTFTGPCSCSGYPQIEPQLFLDPLDLMQFFAMKGAHFVDSTTMSSYDYRGTMFGRDWRQGMMFDPSDEKQIAPPSGEIHALVNILAQKPI